MKGTYLEDGIAVIRLIAVMSSEIYSPVKSVIVIISKGKMVSKMTLIRGKTCPKCKKSDRIIEQQDKSKVLYFNMQGAPQYARMFKCGNCGELFKAD